MAAAYFFTTNAVRPIQLEGRQYKFVPMTLLAGRVSGVFDTEDPTDIAILRRAVAARQGIQEISAEEAARTKKKVSSRAKASRISLAGELPPPPVKGAGPLFAVEAVAGSAASAAQPVRPAGEITMPTVTSLVRTGKVNPPQPLVHEKDRMLRSRLNK